MTRLHYRSLRVQIGNDLGTIVIFHLLNPCKLSLFYLKLLLPFISEFSVQLSNVIDAIARIRWNQAFRFL